jgi:hypothetical protein
MTERKHYTSTELMDTIAAFGAGFMGALGIELLLIFGYMIAAK